MPEMFNLKDAKPSDKIHLLLYGDSGTGKTHLAGQFPNPLIIDTDNGWETLFGQDVDVEAWATRVGEDNAKTAWPELLDRIESFSESPTHETFVLDSLTTVIEVVVAYILGRANRSQLQLQDYTPLYDELNKLILRLRRVPTNMVLTAHEETTRDEYNAKLLVRPLAIGQQFPRRLPIFFSNIYNIVAEKPKRRDEEPERLLLVQTDGTRMAKSQANNRDTLITKSYDSIVEHLNRKEK